MFDFLKSNAIVPAFPFFPHRNCCRDLRDLHKVSFELGIPLPSFFPSSGATTGTSTYVHRLMTANHPISAEPSL